MNRITKLTAFCTLLLASCAGQKNLSKQATRLFVEDESLKHAHVGVSVYQASTGKYLYQHQADQFFIPASNTKIVTTYAAMKYLKDSIPGIRYYENDTAVFLLPTGDPTLLHEDYKTHPVFEFLKSTPKKIYISEDQWKSRAFGSAWSWDYYSFYYGAERSPLPVYGNYIKFTQQENGGVKSYVSAPASLPWKVNVSKTDEENFFVRRDWRENEYNVTIGKATNRAQDVPYLTDGLNASIQLLEQALGKKMYKISLQQFPSKEFKVIYSQPLDSMLKPLMYRSDNFFAEQTLMMVANELTGEMNDFKATEMLKKGIYKTVPNDFRWADGSGLSRMNHFTPNDFIEILKLFKADIGMERIRAVFPHGGVGTLGSLYKDIADNLRAKTGSLTGVIALSGYLDTKSGDQLIFSLLVNNHRGDAAYVRQQYKEFLMYLYNNY
jgi:D-alanyl-D-alanine carboxypeptidase/D-alanyl-D-alanine-endopeptidase (penicillin-binding protein 4)